MAKRIERFEDFIDSSLLTPTLAVNVRVSLPLTEFESSNSNREIET